MNTNIDFKTRDVRAAQLFRLLSPPPPPQPSGVPNDTEVGGNWKVEHYDEAVRWTCLCRRSEPFLMRPKDVPKVKLPLGVAACEVCRAELSSANSRWKRIDAWLERCRFTLEEGRCLERDDTPKPNPRLLRRVYERFWKKSVGSADCVKSVCSNPNCINPYHLCLVKTPASRLTKESEEFLKQILLAGATTDTALQLLREKHSSELSRRSIQRIRKDLNKSKNCAG